MWLTVCTNPELFLLIPPLWSNADSEICVGMVAGGGQKLGTPELPYPKQDLSKLKILKSLATTLEIESLVGLIDKDIAAAALGPSPLPASGLAPKPTVKDAVPSEKLCWFCHKRG